MPAAGRLLSEHDLDAADVPASGPGGRLLKEDVLAYLEGRKGDGPEGNGDQREQAKDEDKGDDQASREATSTSSEEPGGSRATERVAMSRIRQRIATRLVESQSTSALLTTFNEVDMSEVLALREAHQERFVERYGIKLGFMSFFVKAAVEALKLIPEVNASIDGDEIVYHRYQDIGIAVGGGRGLVVPVIRNAERRSLAEIESTIADFAKRAKANKLEIDELQGGTFTISNGGVYGSLMSTPIVNPPQSGILGLHAMQDRPVVRDGEIVVRPMMYVALTYDHRLIDGRESVTFLKRIKECVEAPARILLEI
jgi:2-oxoglutarate dehydrogenase E2 component (dihydrolipoamide succinyltransferase)